MGRMRRGYNMTVIIRNGEIVLDVIGNYDTPRQGDEEHMKHIVIGINRVFDEYSTKPDNKFVVFENAMRHQLW
jgi:hypothetical protein